MSVANTSEMQRDRLLLQRREVSVAKWRRTPGRPNVGRLACQVGRRTGNVNMVGQ
jgi:hypothetical protein